jgi:hypothetical protein
MTNLRFTTSLLILALFLMAGTPGIANAQQPVANSASNSELQAFDKFLDAHPAIAGDVRQNPSLVNDPSYLKTHPELAGFMQDHPNAAQALKGNPGAFMSSEAAYDKRQGENPAAEDTELGRQRQAYDQFLGKHPQIAKDLSRNPALVNDPSYLKSHPQLREFFQNHPNVHYELAQNPNAFANGAVPSATGAPKSAHSGRANTTARVKTPKVKTK